MNYELLCEVLLEVLQDFRTEAKRLQSENKELQKKIEAEKIFNAYYTELQHERDQFLRNNKELQSKYDKYVLAYDSLLNEDKHLQLKYEELQSEKTNLLLHRNSLQAENNKLILERDRLQSNFELAQSVVADLQLKNDEKRQLLKERGVIIDDSIVREESK